MWIADLTWLPAQGEVESRSRPREDCKHSSSGSCLNVSSRWWPSSEVCSGHSSNKAPHIFQRMWAVSFQAVSRIQNSSQESSEAVKPFCCAWLIFCGRTACYGHSEGRLFFLTLKVTLNIISEISFCMVWSQKGHSCFEPSFAQTDSLHLESIRRLKLLPSIDTFVPLVNSLVV